MTTPPSDARAGQPSGGPVHQPMTPEQWREGFLAANHREPTMSEYQNAVRAGWIKLEGQRGQTAEQFSEGAKKFAAGTKDLWNRRVVPAASSAAGSVRAQVQQRSGGRGSQLPVWGAFALIALAVLSIVSAAMPAVNSMFGSYSFFNGSDGVFVTVFAVLAAAAAGMFLGLRARWARISAGVLGLLTGLTALFVAFSLVHEVHSSGYGRYVSIGGGTVLMIILGFLLLPASVLLFLPAAAKAPTGEAFAAEYPGQQPGSGPYPGQQTGQSPRHDQQPTQPAPQGPTAEDCVTRPDGNDVPPTT